MIDSVIIFAGSLEIYFRDFFSEKQMLSLQVLLLMNLFWMFDHLKRRPTSSQWTLPKDYRIMVQDYKLLESTNTAFHL